MTVVTYVAWGQEHDGYSCRRAKKGTRAMGTETPHTGPDTWQLDLHEWKTLLSQPFMERAKEKCPPVS
jgi:hypothetical protein